VLAWCGIGALGRAVSFWHDSGGLDLPGGVLLLPTGRGAAMPPAAPLARGSVDSIFDYFSVNPFRANRDRTKPGRIRHLRINAYLGSITGRLRPDCGTIPAGQPRLFAQCPSARKATKS
jgi:hypothetical protein